MVHLWSYLRKIAYPNSDSGSIYAFQNIEFALRKTHQTKLEALSGLLPLVYFFFCSFLILRTEWGSNNPALMIYLLCPMYCEMATKHIICSVTKVSISLLMPLDEVQSFHSNFSHIPAVSSEPEYIVVCSCSKKL